MTAPARTPDAHRRAMLAKLHVAKTQMALGDEAYRDLLERVTGQRSAKALGAAQIEKVLEEFKRQGWKPKATQPKRAGRRPIAHGELQGKVRALWLALYHLGEVRSPEEAAIDAFVKRQVGVASLRWLSPVQGARVVEALKQWAERAGVDWSPYAGVAGQTDAPKARVIEAQWRRLHALGAVRIADDGALASWLHRRGHTPGLRAPNHLDDATADRVIEDLGRWIRRAAKG